LGQRPGGGAAREDIRRRRPAPPRLRRLRAVQRGRRVEHGAARERELDLPGPRLGRRRRRVLRRRRRRRRQMHHRPHRDVRAVLDRRDLPRRARPGRADPPVGADVRHRFRRERPAPRRQHLHHGDGRPGGRRLDGHGRRGRARSASGSPRRRRRRRHSGRS
jgi:hypothetical protein